MDMHVVKIEKPDAVNVILGQSHFIKSVEDIYEAVVNTVPGVQFAVAFCEASGACKIRCEGTDAEMKQLARDNAEAVAAGHTFIICIRNAYPINILNAIKNVPEVCGIFCATANPLEVIVVQSELGRGIIGVIDGNVPQGHETTEDMQWRKSLLRNIGYKL